MNYFNVYRSPRFEDFENVKLLENFRIVGVIDIDAFECQVWQRKYPHLVGFPCVVADSSGRIVSVTHEAKLFGISRTMRVHKATNICPDLHVFEKPNRFNKPDNQLTRDASWETTTSIQDYCSQNDKSDDIIVEYKPNDQWFFDLTKYVEKMIISCTKDNPGVLSHMPCLRNKWENVYFEDHERERNEEIKEQTRDYSFLYLHDKSLREKDALIIGGAVMHEITEHIFDSTGFHCSAGIAINVLQAKLACQHNKPKSVTILTEAGLKRIAPKIPYKNIPGLGSTLGEKISEEFPYIDTMAELQIASLEFLKAGLTEEEAATVYDLARGICNEKVKSKLMTKFVSCGKNNLKIRQPKHLEHTVRCLSQELLGRLKEERHRNHRIPEDDMVKVSFIYYHCNETDYRAHPNDWLKTKEFPAVLYYDSEDLTSSCINAAYKTFPYLIDIMTITAVKISVTRFEKL